MLTHEELATIRAALRYWRDEISPVGKQLARHYSDDDECNPLVSSPSITQLVERFSASAIRYATVREQEFTSPLLKDLPEMMDPDQLCVSVVLRPDTVD